MKLSTMTLKKILKVTILSKMTILSIAVKKETLFYSINIVLSVPI
jgi:hypothetical protein